MLCLATAGAAGASGTGMRIAQAVALLDVVLDHCGTLVAIDPARRAALTARFRDYDVAGVQSTLAGPLNSYYEDYAAMAGKDRRGFCRSAPDLADAAGFEGLFAAH